MITRKEMENKDWKAWAEDKYAGLQDWILSEMEGVEKKLTIYTSNGSPYTNNKCRAGQYAHDMYRDETSIFWDFWHESVMLMEYEQFMNIRTVPTSRDFDNPYGPLFVGMRRDDCIYLKWYLGGKFYHTNGFKPPERYLDELYS